MQYGFSVGKKRETSFQILFHTESWKDMCQTLKQVAQSLSGIGQRCAQCPKVILVLRLLVPLQLLLEEIAADMPVGLKISNRFKTMESTVNLKMVQLSGLSLPLMATSTQYMSPPPYFDFLPNLWLGHWFQIESLELHLVATSYVQFHFFLSMSWSAKHLACRTP